MMRWTLTAILVLLALAAGWYAGHRAPAAAAPVAQAPAPQAAAPADAGLVPAGKGFNPDFVKTALPQRQAVTQGIPVTGKLGLDKRLVRIAAARVAGRLGRIFVFEGQSVPAGAPLAEIYSPDYISAENELLLARRFRDTLAAGGEAGLREDAAATYTAAVSRMKVLGASPADIAALERRGKVQEYLQVRAPIGGVVTQRNVDPGGYLNIGDTLMTLAETDTLWLTFNTYDGDYAALKLGQALRFSTSSLPGESFTGHVAFIAPALDPATHTLPVRCDIPNPGLRLRPEMFVAGQLDTGETEAWVVPRAAVFRIREQDYVFVQDGGQGYRRAAVQGRALDGGLYAVSAGLPEGKPVVVEGAVLLNQMAAQ